MRVWLEKHPMKSEAKQILKKYFHPSIVKNFLFFFEAELFDAPNIRDQIRDDKLIMEVRYNTGQETSEYICDIYNFMTKQQAEYKLLRYITDAIKAGKLGTDWEEKNGKVIAKEIKSGKYETKGGDDK